MSRSFCLTLAAAALGLCLAQAPVRAASPLIETRSQGLADPSQIIFDHLDTDWPAGSLYTSDAIGDGAGGTDWEYVRLADDPTYLYGYLKTANNGFALGDIQFWLDMDENQLTGLAPGALPVGAERIIISQGGSAVLVDAAVNSLGFLDSQAGENVAFGGTPDGGFGLEFRILRSRLADDGNAGLDWWANSYIGGETYPEGSGTADGPHNKYIFANEPPPPPPPAIGSYTYELNPAVANPPSTTAIIADPGLTKLTDGVADNPNWLNAPNQWVGSQDPTFVPANLAGDNELPQPRVEFVMDPSTPLESVTITYMVENDAKVYAPDYVILSFSTDGSEFGGDIADFGFDNTPDAFPNPPTVAEGEIRTLTIPLGGVTADRVRLDFYNDFEWTLLGEVQFNAAVPEPSSGVLATLAAACCGFGAWRRSRRG